MMDVSFDGGRYEVEDLPPVNAVAIQDILAHTKERLVIHTTKGTVVMKHITKRMKDHIDRIRMTRYPRVLELEQEANIVFPLVIAGNADPDTVARANAIAADLMPIQDLYMLGCIEYPFLTTAEDLEAFMESLEDEEREAVRQCLALLTSWNYPIDYSALELAERFHLQLVTMEHITEPTYEQYRALYGVIEQEHAETEKLYRSLGAMR